MALALGVGQPEQAHENGNTFFITLGHTYGTFRERPEGLVQGSRFAVTLCFQFVERSLESCRERRQKTRENRLNQRVL